ETLQPFEGEGGADFLARLRLSLQPLGKAELTGSRDLPFAGGLLGYMAYDFGRRLEPGLERGLQSDTHSAIADARFGLYDWALISDHEALTTQLVFHPRCSEERRRRVLNVFDESGASEGIPETASAHSMGPPLGARGFQLLTSFSPSITREAYRQGIERIHRYIQAGDCYQVNYTQRFEARYRGDPWLAYRRLRGVCPVPFAGYVGLGGENAILSLSPERFLRLSRGWVEARPIKGTRPRGATPETDELQAQALLNSEKDRAEILMIVDLLRNDIGRVARIGSVRVPELFSLESYPNVHHLVSSVGAELAPGLDAF